MPGRPPARASLFLVILAVGLSACRPSPASLEPGDADNPIAPEFISFWEDGGGLSTFGPPLESARRRGGVVTQTFLAVQLTYDPDKEAGPVRLAPLGLDLGLAEPASPPGEGSNGRYFPETGHTLYTGFAPLFGALGGVNVVGAPISEVRFESGRITQYFENLGMVRPENASPSEVRLVALGLAAQPGGTAFGVEIDQVILPGVVRQRPFGGALEIFGGESVLGQPMSEPYVASDGAVEQVYERAVVYASDADSRLVHFRAVGHDLWAGTPPVPRVDDAGGVYSEATGHNVLYAFADFYRDHEGNILLGAPIEEVRVEGSSLAQRFENGELVYRYDLPPELAVQMSPIGERYLALHPLPAELAVAEPSPTAEVVEVPQTSSPGRAIALQVMLARAVVPLEAAQVISIRVTSSDGTPIAGIQPRLAWYGLKSSGSQLVPASDADGRTELSLTLEEVRPFEIITLVVTVRTENDQGSAVVQYAMGLPASK